MSGIAVRLNSVWDIMTKKRKLQPLEGSPKSGRITTITQAIDSEPQPIRRCCGEIEKGLEVENP